MLCSKAQYWDALLQSCKPCRLACHPLRIKACADVCWSLDCSKRVGFYYDNLIRDCINCSSVCGQHPTECHPFCPKMKPWGASDTPPIGKQENFVATLPTPAALWDVQCNLDFGCNPQTVYLVLGICLCFLLFSLLVTWIYSRKHGEEVACQGGARACHKTGDGKKDGLLEEGSTRSGSSGNQTPEPIETCGFCFPDTSPAVQETRACPRTYQFGMQGDAPLTGNPGTIPIPEDGHFQIICSPSQEKAHLT